MANLYSPTDLDRALFQAPFIVINADNAVHGIAYELDEAVHILNTEAAARSLVGTLRPPMFAIDIDPDDTGATPEAGDAVAEQLILWADRYGLPWLRRDSGRDGHAHLVIKTPDCLRHELNAVANAVAIRQNVATTVRTSLRLTSAPHRHSLPCPLRGGTLVLNDLPPSATTKRRPNRTLSAPPRASYSGPSRSEGEYGHALALARACFTSLQAWAYANLAGTKAREIGETAWRRWIWAPATTVVAAERHLSERQAWQIFRDASPIQARHLGQAGWHYTRWLPAVDQAAQFRPRRRSLHRTQLAQPASDATANSKANNEAMQHAIDALLSKSSSGSRIIRSSPTEPGVQVRSMRAALAALAHAIAVKDGSISVREWAERSHLDPKTVRRARDVALKLGIIKLTQQYRGGSHDSDAFTLPKTDLRTSHLSSKTSPTSYTPKTGNANVSRLQAQHHKDRIAWTTYLSTTNETKRTNTSSTFSQKPPRLIAYEEEVHVYKYRGRAPSVCTDTSINAPTFPLQRTTRTSPSSFRSSRSSVHSANWTTLLSTTREANFLPSPVRSLDRVDDREPTPSHSSPLHRATYYRGSNPGYTALQSTSTSPYPRAPDKDHEDAVLYCPRLARSG